MVQGVYTGSVNIADIIWGVNILRDTNFVCNIKHIRHFTLISKIFVFRWPYLLYPVNLYFYDDLQNSLFILYTRVCFVYV